MEQVQKNIKFHNHRVPSSPQVHTNRHSIGSIFIAPTAKKYRHTLERCWKLNDRPPNRNNSDGKQAHLSSNPKADEKNPQSTSTGSCSLAFTCISCSFVTNVSAKLSPIWVVDSGATDHMTSSSHLFISYSLSPRYKK